jgi:hypothetical protein
LGIFSSWRVLERIREELGEWVIYEVKEDTGLRFGSKIEGE